MGTIEARLASLEARQPERKPLLILRQIIEPGNLDALPVGTWPAPPYLPAIDALPGEGWEAFSTRVRGMIAHLPAGTAVRVVSR